MKQGFLVIALVFSLGLNLGLGLRWLQPDASPSPPAELPATSPEGPEGPEDPFRDSRPTDRRPRSREPEPRPGLRQAAEQLGLEGEQRRRFLEVKRDFFQRTAVQRRQVRDLQGELGALLARPGADRAEIAKLVDRLGEAHGELEGLFAEHFLATLDLLDPEQQITYREEILTRLRRPGWPRGGERPAERRPTGDRR